ncbi:Hpt domain-containing protein [Burkholderia pyrrocinia]|uniref:Hpt domain-containing protein n=2 Tax=Burkholderia TaxID=32008 RepID=UPI001588CB9C
MICTPTHSSRNALTHRDLKVARTEIHSMRGAFAMIGESGISDLCATLERLALAGDSAAFARGFERYREQAGDALTRRMAAETAHGIDAMPMVDVPEH